jgi:hypothetical protein
MAQLIPCRPANPLPTFLDRADGRCKPARPNFVRRRSTGLDHRRAPAKLGRHVEMLDSHSEPRVVGILCPNIQVDGIQGVSDLGRNRLGDKAGRAFPFPRSFVGRTGSAFVRRCKAAPSHRGKDTPDHKKDAHRQERHHCAQNGQIYVVRVNFGKIIWHCRARAVWGVPCGLGCIVKFAKRCLVIRLDQGLTALEVSLSWAPPGAMLIVADGGAPVAC